MRFVAVFDTNVVFSATGWKGVPNDCLESARKGVVEGVTCRELLDELSDKLQSKLSFTAEQSFDTIVDLLNFLRVVPITGQLNVLAADPDDNKVLECSTTAGATHIVTGDRRHLLPLKTFHGVQIAPPAEFLVAVATVP